MQRLAPPGSVPRVLGFYRGHLGVELFFIISGFVILRTLERCRGIGDFAISRISRLYPSYIACSLLTAGFIFASGDNPHGLTLRDALLNVFMLSDLLHVREISFTYWTLQYEALFYLAAAAVYLGLRLRRIEIPCLLWLLVELVGQARGWPRTHTHLAMLACIGFAHLFVIGMMIHRLEQRPRDRLAAVTLLCALPLALFPRDVAPGSVLLPATVVFTLAVWLAARERLRALCAAPLLFLGDISYSLYLVHVVIGRWLIRRLFAAGWHPLLAEAAALALVLALAACLRRWIERPGQSAIRSAWRRLGGRVHATELPAVV